MSPQQGLQEGEGVAYTRMHSVHVLDTRRRTLVIERNASCPNLNVTTNLTKVHYVRNQRPHSRTYGKTNSTIRSYSTMKSQSHSMATNTLSSISSPSNASTSSESLGFDAAESDRSRRDSKDNPGVSRNWSSKAAQEYRKKKAQAQAEARARLEAAQVEAQVRLDAAKAELFAARERTYTRVAELFGWEKNAKDTVVGEVVEEKDDLLHRKRGESFLKEMPLLGSEWLEATRCPQTNTLLETYPSLVDLAMVDMTEEEREQIDRDMPRTFPDQEYFKDPSVKLSLKRVLRAIAVAFPEVGYVQGMSFIAGFFLLHTHNEQETFALLGNLLVNPKYNMRSVFVAGLPGLLEIKEKFAKVLKERDQELFAHLEQHGLGEFEFMYQWVLTLFSYTMSFDCLTDVWDAFFRYGWHLMFKVYVTLIDSRRETLRSAEFEEMFEVLRDLPEKPDKNLLSKALEVELSEDHMQLINDLFV